MVNQVYLANELGIYSGYFNFFNVELEEKLEENKTNGDLNVIQKVVGVFFTPKETFQAIDRKPDWIVPMVIIIVISLLCTMLTLQYTMPEQMQKQREKLEERGMSNDQIDQALATGEKMGKVMAPVGVIVGVPIVTLFFTLIVWFIGNVVLGGQTSFKKMFSVYAYSSLIGTFGFILMSLVMLMRQSGDVHFSLALLLSENQSDTALYQFLKGCNLFSIWQYAVLAIGFAVIYKFSMKKSGWTMAVLFLITVLISVGFQQIFG